MNVNIMIEKSEVEEKYNRKTYNKLISIGGVINELCDAIEELIDDNYEDLDHFYGEIRSAILDLADELEMEIN